MSKTTRTLVLRASADLPAGTETGPWVRLPGDARIIKTKVSHGALGGFHLDAKLQWATSADGVVFDGITNAQDAATGFESAETDAYLTFVRYVVTATGGTVPTVKFELELTQHPFAPTDSTFDLLTKQVLAATTGTTWKQIPASVLAYLAVIDADAASAGATVDVKLQEADDALGTNATDVVAGAFTQITNAATLKQVKGPFIPKKNFVRALATFGGAAGTDNVGLRFIGR